MPLCMPNLRHLCVLTQAHDLLIVKRYQTICAFSRLFSKNNSMRKSISGRMLINKIYEKVPEKSLKRVTLRGNQESGKGKRKLKNLLHENRQRIQVLNIHSLFLFFPTYTHTHTCSCLCIQIVRSYLQPAGTRKIINKYIIRNKSLNIYYVKWHQRIPSLTTLSIFKYL